MSPSKGCLCRTSSIASNGSSDGGSGSGSGRHLDEFALADAAVARSERADAFRTERIVRACIWTESADSHLELGVLRIAQTDRSQVRQSDVRLRRIHRRLGYGFFFGAGSGGLLAAFMSACASCSRR